MGIFICIDRDGLDTGLLKVLIKLLMPQLKDLSKRSWLAASGLDLGNGDVHCDWPALVENSVGATHEAFQMVA